MRTPVYGAIQSPPYWNGWALSACMHTVLVGAALFLSHQLPTPQKAGRNPIAVAFVTPQSTHMKPTHRPTMQKSPPTPAAKPKQVQPEVIPREQTRSKPLTQAETRKKVSPKKVAQRSPKPAPQPKLQVTNVTQIPVAQPKTVRHTQATSQPAVKNGRISTQAVAHVVGTPAPKAMAQHTGIARQPMAAKIQASPSHKKPIRINATTDKVRPRNQVIHHHVTNAPQPIATPVRATRQRKSVNTLPSHEEKITRAPAMGVLKQQIARGKSYTAVKHVSSKPVRQQASLSSGRPVVATRTTMNYAHLTRKVRPVTTSRSVSADGLSPELLAFSRLLREKVARTLKFPRLAKRLGYSGTTHVSIALSKTGIVRDLKVSQPSGYEILDKAAIVTLQEVLQTTKPPESIEIEQLVIPIAFNLKRN